MTRVTNWWSGDYDQNRAINDLDEELAAERAARHQQNRRLQETRSQLDKSLKKVDSKLSGVSERIDTVLNWTELRFQLLEFDEYQARKDIRKTFRALAENRPALPPEFEDVPGYWLPPAAAAVLPLILRERSTIATSHSLPFADLKSGFEAARERDGVRAELFNLAVGRSFDQPALIDAAVLRLLGEPTDLGFASRRHPEYDTAEPQVAASWRTLWEQTVLGEFGPGAVEQLRTVLRERFDPDAVDATELEAWDLAIATFGAEDGKWPSKAEAYEPLAAHLAEGEETVAGGVLPGGITSDGLASGGLTSGGTALETTALDTSVLDTTTLDTTAFENTAPARDDRAWHRYLQELIEEPSPAELPLVREMEALELADADASSRPTWSGSAGTVASLLRRDLFDPEGPLALRRFALDLAGPLLRSRLQEPEPPAPPAVVLVKRRSLTVEVTAKGHDKKQAAAVESRIAQAGQAAPSKAGPGGVAAVLLALAAIMVFTGQWFVAILFALATLVPYWWFRGQVADHAKDLSRREDQLADLRAALAKAREEAAAQDVRITERRTADVRAREILLEALPAVEN
ncbi:hypothetical protein [Glycomyces sp. NRRL B-16210]|uniref:hypothetical protein n=1 Tax=Glycomyces sp. NRRL B-16210 TaxID=1463821 RepID=UPI0004C047DB|nr:hypothetical protein [Glycomyces sp. NRRL B-16210]